VAHISDTHLGYARYSRLSPENSRNQREVDVAAAYERVVDDILGREVDLVIHSGDVFDSVRPATHVIIHFLKQTAKLTRRGIPCLGIAGNHETPRLRTTTAALEYANLVRAYFAVGFAPEYEPVDVGDTRVGITLVPHGAVLDREIVVTPDRGADLNIMVTHGTVPGLTVQGHELGEVNLPNRVLEGDFDYVALGHYHYFHAHKENSYYAGATERFSFGEANSQPGFAILEFSSEGVGIEHVAIEARPMVDLPKINASDMTGADLSDAVRERAESANVDGAIVRQKVVDAPRGLLGEVDRATLRHLRRRCLNYSLEVTEPGTLQAVGVRAEAGFSSLEEEFKAFAEARCERGDLTPTFTGEFLERGLRYLENAARGELR
jgi:DNA repair exonuclease SbcCD nuclease subunit